MGRNSPDNRQTESLVDAVRRVAWDELALEVEVGELLGYIEYPSHYNNADSIRASG